MFRHRLALLLGALLLPVSCQSSDEAAEFRERVDATFQESMESFSEGLAELQDDFARTRAEAREQWEENGESEWAEARAEMKERVDELEAWLADARDRFAAHAPEIQDAEDQLAELREEIANTEEP